MKSVMTWTWILTFLVASCITTKTQWNGWANGVATNVSPAAAIEPTDVPKQNQEIKCEGTYPHHLQGVCCDESFIYWSFTTTLVKTDRQGKRLQQVKVVNHHGDLCLHDGKLYVAVNLGKFNDPLGNADCWVYVYDSKSLKFLKKFPVQEVFHGAGGMSYRDDHFFVIGGLPDNVPENYVYEYDQEFHLVKKHRIQSGHTHLGIQTAAFAHDRWWFGCYGSPPILLVADENFDLLGRYELDCSLGVVGIEDGQLLVAKGKCIPKDGCSGSLRLATPSDERGFTINSTVKNSEEK